MKPRLVAIAAMDEARGIGWQGGLPWKIPGELKFFKEQTMGHAVLFGRTTFEGMGRLLPGRKTYVLSRHLPPRPGITLLRDAQEVKTLPEPLVYICGGTEVYRQLLPECEMLWLTRVRGIYPADACFPDFEELFYLDHVIEETPAWRREQWTRR